MTGTKTLTSPLVRGATGRYSFVARNTGGAPTVNPQTVLDPMPAGLTLVSASGPGWDCTASTPANMSCTRAAIRSRLGLRPRRSRSWSTCR